MPAQIINEALFQFIADSLGMGNTWKVLKGRFLTAFRAWGTVIKIWQSKTEEDLEKVLEKSESDIAEIKARYRDAETKFAEENQIINSAYGNHLLFFQSSDVYLSYI